MEKETKGHIEQHSKTQNKNLKPGVCLLGTIMLSSAFFWSGGAFFYDFPQLFEEILIKKFGVSTVEVGILYSVTSTPSVIFTPFTGFIAGYIGLNTTAVILSSLIFSGVLISYIAVASNNFMFLIIGRGLFGFAYESAYVVAASCTEKWFTGRFLSMAFAFNRSLCYLLSSIAAYIQPTLFITNRTLETPLFVYGAFAGFCAFTGFVYFILDRKYEKKILNSEENEISEEKMSLKDLKKIGSQAWIILVIFAVMSQCLYQFTNIGTDCLMKRFGFDYIEAKNRIALIPIVNMIMIPVFSSITSCIGKKGIFLTAGALLITVNYTFLSFLGTEKDERVVFGVIGVGVFFSLLTATFWSSFSLLLPKQAVAVLFGFAITSQNLLLSLLPPVFSYFTKERTHEAYQRSFYLLIGIGAFSLVLCLVLTIRDIKGSKAMHLPENHELVAENRKRMNQRFSESGDGGKVNALLKESMIGEEESFMSEDLDL